ncbi:MAG: DNA-3-methyladenine glycosylase I [Chloroflexi bacterium]|nr:DNA-3-methyladenine glycosylase I [Chloroflexota bacterium]
MSERKRCGWAALGSELMLRYHDEEWGEPAHDDRRHFEMLVLEGAQAGLSWTTILNKRENYRRAFDGFDYEKVARYTQRDVKRLLGDAGIVRNKLKVASAISNAQALIAVREEFGSFDSYIWGFVGGKPKVNSFRSYKELPATTPESDAMAKDLKQRGFRFVGPTVCYAHMQSVGMVDDHEVGCFRRTG